MLANVFSLFLANRRSKRKNTNLTVCGGGGTKVRGHMEGAVIKIGSRHLMATWVRRQHAGPLNEKNERLSAPLLRTHLHAVGFHYGWSARQELQDSPEPPFLRTGPAPPIRPTRLIGSLVRWTPDSFCVKVFWPLLLLHPLQSSLAPSLGSLREKPLIGSA